MQRSLVILAAIAALTIVAIGLLVADRAPRAKSASIGNAVVMSGVIEKK